MASGQIYDMNDPTTTAANIFPFGTWLKVTNLANGKSVVVQVRDRGGFSHALDLSYAAFALLDDPKKMAIRVRYEVVAGPEALKEVASSSQPTPAPAPSPAPPPPKPQATSQPEGQATAAAPSQTSYTVSLGDTLTRIAARFNVTKQALIEINGLTDPDNILVGQVIKLRDDAPPKSLSSRSGSADGSKEDQAESGSEFHRVEAGQTLSDIALLYNTTVEQLQSLNGITDPNLVRIGDNLRIRLTPDQASPPPASEAKPKVHVVQSGETLSGIAYRYGIPTEVLAGLNGLSDADQIIVGQELRLTQDAASASTAASNPREHTVQPGDTLSGIAAEYGMSVEAIVSLNALGNEDLLLPGQVLKLR